MSNCNSCPSKNSCSSKATCNIENNPNNKIKKIIGIMSGKGGVGKSTVTVLLAKKLNKMGYKVGILDSDITGPSIPRLMGLQNERAFSTGKDIYPVESIDNIKTMSINFMVDNENQPIVWKGPMVGNAVKQFYKDVMWGELDYLLIDMPPGTGDVALTVMQSIPLSGVVMVSVPQDMISMIVSKAVSMAKMLNVNVLGVVENMSYIQCPDCSKKIKLFDGEETNKFLSDMNLNLLGELPMTKEIVNITHHGVTEVSDELDLILTNIVDKIK
ncbi:Mrp/NBP35 family ATP-binding protein [Romboutsia sp.]|uniref:Mrp/NBP35 family ATP-binding protein n=1 Tax=Romboutsia sp. TaxID=1965302 RepID=UPI002B653DAA|nr:Mrp/NBP35 family ATP-binding protein [Romboutsia sp.]HSQ89271.1 Mrp/NBP35 family ATP-binding protein [Romboutsia sp.]